MRVILVDGNEANVDQTVGVSVYTLHLLEYFKKHASHDIRFCVYLRQKPKLHLPRENQYFRYRVVWGPGLWLKVFLPLRLIYDYAIQRLRHILHLQTIWFYSFFAPAHYAPRWLPPRCRLVVTLHDLAYEFFPDEFLKKDLQKLQSWTLDAIARSSYVITVSVRTKLDAIKVYDLPEQRVFAIPNGFSPPQVASARQTPLINGHDYQLIPYKYLLYVGTIQPRKNITTLIYAFALFHKEHPDYKLVIAGKKGWMYEEVFSLVHKIKVQHVVHFVGYVNEQDKTYLYTKAFCLVMPSMYEGFGLPILEAFASHCPVISSNTSSLPEVAGNAALYFDPKQVNDLVDKLRSLEKDLKLRQTCIERGDLQSKKFSWEACGEATLNVLLKQ